MKSTGIIESEREKDRITWENIEKKRNERKLGKTLMTLKENAWNGREKLQN